mgnify:CR=1 FL=1
MSKYSKLLRLIIVPVEISIISFGIVKKYTLDKLYIKEEA